MLSPLPCGLCRFESKRGISSLTCQCRLPLSHRKSVWRLGVEQPAVPTLAVHGQKWASRRTMCTQAGGNGTAEREGSPFHNCLLVPSAWGLSEEQVATHVFCCFSSMYLSYFFAYHLLQRGRFFLNSSETKNKSGHWTYSFLDIEI